MQAPSQKGKQTGNGPIVEVEPLMMNSENGHEDRSAAKSPIYKPPKSPERQPVTAAGQQFSFSSVPNIVFSSTRTSDKGGSMRHTPIKRATSHNFATDKILLRHVGKEVTPEVKQPAQKPIGLSFIGLSDFSLNKVRERTHLPLSRRDITISGGSVLHIPEHSVQESYIRSLTSIKSQGAMSIKSEAERILCSCLPESVRETLLQMLDFSIMKNKAYVFILIGNICAMLGFYVPFVFIPERAMKLGFSEDKAAFLLSIIGMFNIFILSFPNFPPLVVLWLLVLETHIDSGRVSS